MMSGRSVMEAMGYEPYQARTLAARFRRHSIAQLHEFATHLREEPKLISMASAGRQQLEQLFAQERRDRPPAPPPWDGEAPADEAFEELGDEAAGAPPSNAPKP